MSPKLQLVFANESSERPYHLDSGSRPQVSAPPGLLICCSLDYLLSLHLGHVRWESGFLHGPGDSGWLARRGRKRKPASKHGALEWRDLRSTLELGSGFENLV